MENHQQQRMKGMGGGRGEWALCNDFHAIGSRQGRGGSPQKTSATRRMTGYKKEKIFTSVLGRTKIPLPMWRKAGEE